MTVIVWDGKTLAADKLSSQGGMIGITTKIHRINGMLVGGAGESAFISEMIQWIKDGRDSAKFPASQRDKDDWQPILLIEEDGSACFYDRTPYPVRLEQKHVTVGSGSEFARAALYLGKTAREAVEVANALCTTCGCGVDSLDLA